MRKRKLLFVYPDMGIGGSTTALLALLHSLDYTQVQVDLLLLQNADTRLALLPRQVHVLPDAAKFDLWTGSAWVKKLCNAVFTGKIFKTLYAVLRAHKKPFLPHLRAALNQMLAYIHADCSSAPDTEYDVAVAYMELWPTAFVAHKVHAKKKIAWVHVDYGKARLCPALDVAGYAAMQRIVCVSQECAQNFAQLFPTQAAKVMYVENLIDAAAVRRKALQAPQEEAFTAFQGFKIITVCRLDSYTKGLDRVVAAAAQLKQSGARFHWYLVGAGADEEALRRQAQQQNVQDVLLFLGAKENPYPYMAGADLFVLASRNEGKPLTVTEAQLLALPVVVTEYAAAHRQIQNGVNGLIIPNDDTPCLAQTVARLIKTPAEIAGLKAALQNVCSKQDAKEALWQLLTDEA